MSSLSGDENSEIVENEPVRRTRSGRTVKSIATLVVHKKTPVKISSTRVTRATRTIQEIEEESIPFEEDESGLPENGVQREPIDEECDSPAIQLHLDDTHEQTEEQIIENQDENINLHQEFYDNMEELNKNEDEIIETEGMIMQESEFETENIPEFDPDEMSEEGNIAELETLASVRNRRNEIPSNRNKINILRVKDSSQMMEDQIESQCILVEDDTNQHFDIDDVEQNRIDGTEESEFDRNEDCDTMNQETDVLQNIYSMEDSEVIIDNEKFPNEEIEFISENIENDVNNFSKQPNQEENYSQLGNIEPQEVIEISDHDSEIVLKKVEPDTEAVSEDELPTEATTKHDNHEYEDVEEVSEGEFFPNETIFQEPETEAVSDEELPAAQPADLGETESVSEDELPLESEKKRKGNKTNKNLEKKIKSNVQSKRKRTAEGEYDPSSPTSENNDETPAKKIAISDINSNEKSEVKPASPKKKTLPELEKYWKAVNDDPTDFTGWTYLLQYVDQENDAEAAREAYNKFLQRYPYCYGYWRKYADYEKKKGDPERVQTVFDQGLNSISLSVDLWLHYINHCKIVYENEEENMREQYERAIQACGLEFRSDRLWESYIKWETENKRFNKVMGIYDRLLNTPTLGYMSHFETFQEFVTSNSPNRILSVDDFLSLRAEVKAILKSEEGSAGTDDAPPGEDLPPSEVSPTDEETRAIREKIISSRRKMHKTNVNAVAARWTFEEGIKRPYFHVKPLERCQLKNWKEYLDYEIEQKDQGRIIILFERCLIACALYDEFWMRFVRYLESLKGDNIDKIRDVYTRACTVHHPKKPNLHLQWATFEESMSNFDKAASILENIDGIIPNMLQIAYRRINLERRRNDLDKSCALYESYITNSKNRTIANNIVVKYARFLCKIKNDTDKAVKVLLKATEKDKDNPRLYLQLIDLGLQRNPIDTDEVISYMDLFIDREHADAEQRVLFAQRKVEFLEDFSDDIRQVLKAHEQFQKCIKQAKERKKTKGDDSKNDATPPKKTKTDPSSTPQAQVGSQSYQYSSSTTPYQSQQQFQSSQYGSQSGYQQGYQQYAPPTDPNYANYQNWQYGQSGPQAYAPYNQWGSYNYY
ncbi:PREDICTED: pre-mRNA-processing factor 39 [Ceratosolen solmsi marchali]|uniref:Pre-mRNA-processing factor 39 n=1 Tax=Ceratosolen solmsi marchali TaxID=326594 RepID=A0AAJ6YDU1_9HYME|nr:PREDICTED: pre-mRNA-processing factor 39 [Ceratosolen solmsi marchali]